MDKRFVSGSLVAALLVMAFVVIAGCTSPTPTTGPTPTSTAVPTPTPGKNFTIVTYEPGEPQYLDTAWDYETAGGEILQNVYETLVFYDGGRTDKLVGVLAKDWNVSADGLTYTFYLRDNVTFHDGTKFNASAVKYNMDRGVIVNGDPWNTDLSPILRGGADYMASGHTQADIQKYLDQKAVEVINETTVQMHLAYPYSYWLYVLAYNCVGMVSPTYDQAHGGYSPDNQSTWMNEHCCGTGPFVFTEWVHKDHITMTRYDNYWGTKALPAQVIIKYSDDYNTRLLALKSGEADIMFGGVGQHYYDLKNDTSLKIDINPTTMDVEFIGMNTRFAPFNNVLVRKAFIESFDYDTYINNVTNGFGSRLNGPIPAGLPGYNTTRAYPQYNKTDAAALLTQAGYGSSNPLNCTLYYNIGNDVRATACLMIKQAIESYNPAYKVNVVGEDWPTFLADQRAKKLPIFYLGWIADYPSPDNFIGPFFYSGSYFAPRVGYKNDQVDTLYQNAMKETDSAKQLAMFNQITDIGMNDSIYILEDQPQNLIAHGPGVYGIVYNPTYSGEIYSTIYK